MHTFSWNHFRSFPVIGILRGFETDLVREIALKAFEFGLRNLEVTMNSASVLEQIEALVEIADGKANVGAGTVLTMEQLELALQAGAQFIVTPVVNIDVIQACASRKIPVFPGAYTATEVFSAWKAGADIVKLFPADLGGPSYLKTLKAPLDGIELIAVNGVRANQVQEYLDAGASGFGLGGTFFDKQRMLDKDWEWMRDQIESFMRFFV